MKFVFLMLVSVLFCSSSVLATSYFYLGDSVLASKTGDVLTYQYADRLGTDSGVRSLPFGQSIIQGDRFGFTGKEQDQGGLHYFGARYYDTNIGRFTSIDPIEDDIHAYAYVKNNPLNFIDADGRKASLADYRKYITKFFVPLVKENYKYFNKHGEYPKDNVLAQKMPCTGDHDCADFAQFALFDYITSAGEDAPDMYANNNLLDGDYNFIRKMSGAANLLESKNTFEIPFDEVEAGDLMIIIYDDESGKRHLHTALFAKKPKGGNWELVYDRGNSDSAIMVFADFSENPRSFVRKVWDRLFGQTESKTRDYRRRFFLVNPLGESTDTYKSSDNIHFRRWTEFKPKESNTNENK